MNIKVELAERTLQLLQAILAEIAKDAATIEDQIARAELMAQWRFLIGTLADLTIEADEALYNQTMILMQAEKSRAGQERK